MDKVVGVDKQEVFALSFFNTKIARGRNPAVFLMENPNAIIGRSQLFAKLGEPSVEPSSTRIISRSRIVCD